jgi:hypothetical protein
VALGIPGGSRRLRQQTQTDEPALVEWQAPQATLRRIIPAVPLLLREFPPPRSAELAGAGGRLTVVLTVARTLT